MELHVSLVGRDNLTSEIYRQLREAILEGRLPAGERLPPTRDLARQLSVSRGTVSLAYEQLASEGYVGARVGAGTFVSGHIASAARQIGPASGALRPRPVWADIPVPAFPLADFDFTSGIPDARLFPYARWRRMLGRELTAAAAGISAYADPAGHYGLRQAIARYLGVARGVRATAEDIVVTSGTQQAVDLVARVLLDPGDQVAVEDPGYGPPRHLLASLGAMVAGVPVDREGLVVDAIPARARLVYISPSHQFPLGVTMSLPRRLALLAWAARHGAAIIEDDYDSEFRYGGRPVEPLQTLDSCGQVIYVGSFSKTMLPTLRLGFVVAPPPLRSALRAAKFVADWHTHLPAQAALARFIADGWFARHVRRMRAVYAQRHRLVADGLRRRFSEQLEVIPSTAGLHMAATARTMSAEQIGEVLRRASAAGVQAQPLAAFGACAPGPPGLVLGYGAIPTDRIPEGLRRLRRSFGNG